MRVRPVRIILCLLLVCCLGCAEETSSQAQHTVQTGPSATGQPDPLSDALRILGLGDADLRRSPAFEEGYRPIARLPLVDLLRQSPFYLHHWAARSSAELQQAGKIGIQEMLAGTLATINGSRGVSARATADKAGGLQLADAYAELCRRRGRAADPAVRRQIRAAGFAESFEVSLARLLAAVGEAAMLIDKARSALTVEEIAFLTERPERFFYPKGRSFNFLTAPTDIPATLVSLAQKIEFDSLFAAADLVAAAIDEFSRSLPEPHQPALFFRDGVVRSGILVDVDTPIGRLIIAGPGDDRIAMNAALSVDLGGNDVYNGKGGSHRPLAKPVTVLIDAAGSDLYEAGRSPAVEGFGCLSVGMLLDRRGNDRYRAGDMAQGVGILGVGVLADDEGDDAYEMGVIGQGFGLFGAGLLLDRRGDDRYLVSGLGQGVGSTMGIGVLCDTEGKDAYLAKPDSSRGNLIPDDWSHTQGVGLSVRSPNWERKASLYGGIGILSDGGGDDFYFSERENCMGASYFLSIGALVDHGGNDWYLPEKGLGIGWAVHLGCAVFIDQQGDDRYYGRHLSGGVASDRSVALMIDYRGSDTYGPTAQYAESVLAEEMKKKGEVIADEQKTDRIQQMLAQNSFGSARKPHALGILIDYGGEDSYTAHLDEFGESFGGLIPPVEPQHWSHALLLDLGGYDTYGKGDRKNNTYRLTMGHGLCYDTEYRLPIADNLPPPPPPADRLPVDVLRAVVKKSAIFDELIRLQDPDVFRRFRVRGSILAAGNSAVTADLLNLLRSSEDRELNRELLEIVDGLLFAGKLSGVHKEAFIALLGAPDSAVQIFAARKLGQWGISDAAGEMVDSYAAADQRVRIQLVRAAGRIAAAESVDFLLKVFRSDPHIASRREAALALRDAAAARRTTDPDETAAFAAAMMEGLADADEVIRTAAAGALGCCPDDRTVRKLLENSLQDDSVYVRRSTAKVLIQTGVKSAIPVFIETLQFPSIDTREHYDRELAKDLAYFCGIDFPSPQRYDYRVWKNWWQANGAAVDLRQNLAIRQAVEKAFASKDESEGIAIFDSLISRYPENTVIRSRYAKFCREWITLGLLTRTDVDAGIYRRCLRLQKILTRLQPQLAEHWEQLAYFHYRLGNIADALSAMETALQIDPQNGSYRKKRDAYRQIMGTLPAAVRKAAS